MNNALAENPGPQPLPFYGMPPRVLHVEDDQDFSAALKCRLEAHGVAVVRAFDGLDGILLSLQHQTDAVLLDLGIPNADGGEVLATLRMNEDTKGIPVIVLSGHKDDRIQRRMKNLGASAFLTKPLNFQMLRDELAKHIDILPQPAFRT